MDQLGVREPGWGADLANVLEWLERSLGYEAGPIMEGSNLM